MMIIQQEASIVLSTDKHRQFCAFEHLATFSPNEPPEVILVGVSALHEVFQMTDGRRNSEWNRIFYNGGQIMLRIYAVSEDKAELIRWATRRVQEIKPRCNVVGFNLRGAAQRVTCSNGVTYDSQKDAAQALGIDASAISRHLRGYTSHVAGYTFIFATTDRGS